MCCCRNHGIEVFGLENINISDMAEQVRSMQHEQIKFFVDTDPRRGMVLLEGFEATLERSFSPCLGGQMATSLTCYLFLSSFYAETRISDVI